MEDSDEPRNVHGETFGQWHERNRGQERMGMGENGYFDASKMNPHRRRDLVNSYREHDGGMGCAAEPTKPENSVDHIWIVVRDVSHMHASFRHPTRHAATTEAERLARANPGSKFFVFELVDCVELELPKVTRHPVHNSTPF